jgi:hypothetical protein
MDREHPARDPARQDPEQEQAGRDPEHEASVNQHKHEPMPASHHADRHQAEPATSEEHQEARPQEPEVHGDAVRDMMGGPPPQGDVPDAPGTQIAAADEGERGRKARYVANAVPGKPDGEVDTRS